MSTLGDAFIIVGAALLLVTLFLGYSLYIDVSTNQNSYFPAKTAISNSSVNSAVSTLVDNMSFTLSAETLILIKIILLFLFGSIGYKFASLGIDANKATAPVKNK